jgi:hypothetical protein
MRFTALVLGFLLSLTLQAQQAPTPPGIQAPKSIKPYTLARCQAVNVDPKAGLLWRVYPSQNVHRATTPKGTLEFTAPPGLYEVELLAITSTEGQGIEVQEARTTIEIEAPAQPLPPTPPTPPQPPAPKPNAEQAIGRISFAGAGCTATVIYPQRPDGRWDILTAAHCCRPGATGTMSLKNGKRFNVKVVAHHPTQDIAWLVTVNPQDDLPYALLAPRNPAVNAKVWHMGYGIDRPGNREEGYVIHPENAQGQTQFYLSVSSGDSGGGILLQSTNEVVSTVCCTMGKGQAARMWGGSCEQIRKTRPKTVDAITQEEETLDDNWTPLQIPLRESE